MIFSNFQRDEAGYEPYKKWKIDPMLLTYAPSSSGIADEPEDFLSPEVLFEASLAEEE